MSTHGPAVSGSEDVRDRDLERQAERDRATALSAQARAAARLQQAQEDEEAARLAEARDPNQRRATGQVADRGAADEVR